MCGCVGFNAPRLSRLRMLDLSGCPLADKGLLAIAGCCRSLRMLSLAGCEDLTDASVLPLIRSNKHLAVLNLERATQLSNKAALALAAGCTKLSSLNLSQLYKIDDEGIAALCFHCRKLQALNISGLRFVTEGALIHIVQQLQVYYIIISYRRGVWFLSLALPLLLLLLHAQSTHQLST
jgi:F-box and leucine-rich repeat protein GRR1